MPAMPACSSMPAMLCLSPDQISLATQAIRLNRTPDVTPTRLTGEGGGKLTCSGELHATDFVTADGESVTERIEALRGNFTEFVTEQLKDACQVSMLPIPSIKEKPLKESKERKDEPRKMVLFAIAVAVTIFIFVLHYAL